METQSSELVDLLKTGIWMDMACKMTMGEVMSLVFLMTKDTGLEAGTIDGVNKAIELSRLSLSAIDELGKKINDGRTPRWLLLGALFFMTLFELTSTLEQANDKNPKMAQLMLKVAKEGEQAMTKRSLLEKMTHNSPGKC